MGRWNSYHSKSNANPALSVLTFNISDDLLDMLAFGIAKGWWVSRSEGMRVALRKGLAIVMGEHEALQEKVIEALELQNKLDPNKVYIKIAGRGYIEILGEA